MIKLNTLAAALAAATTLAGCATTSGDPFEKQAPAAPKTASATFGSPLCEAQIRASNAAAAAKEKLGKAATPNTNLPTDKECVGVYIKAVADTQLPPAKGRKAGSTAPTEGSAKIYPTESHFVRLDLPNCNQGYAAVPNLVAQGIGAFANVAGQAAGNGALAQTGKRAAQEAVKNAQQPTKTTTGISAACKADLSEAYDLASKAIAEMKTAYAEAQGVPSTTVQVMLVPTFDPKYLVPAAPSKK